MRSAGGSTSRSSPDVIVFALERGCAWGRLDSLRVAGADCVVLAQHAEEPGSAFARRVCRRLAALQGKGRRIAAAVLGANEASGVPFGHGVMGLADELMATLPVATRLCIRRGAPSEQPVTHRPAAA